MSAMSQQVNLLIDELRPKRELLTAAQALVGAAVFALLLVAYSVYGLVAVSRVDEQRQGLAKQLATLADANAKVRASINVVEDPKLASHVADLRSQLASRTVLVAALSGTTNGRSAGFAKHFDELAAHVQAGLWLTDIELSGGGGHIRLAGMTLDPVLVPRFLKELGQGEQFVGHRFDTFELAAGDGGALHFTITGPDGDSK
jgi:Tfp pilus assembly protein PilN